MSRPRNCFDRGAEWSYSALPSGEQARRAAARALCAGCPFGAKACARLAVTGGTPFGMVWAGVALPDWASPEHKRGMAELRLLEAGLELPALELPALEVPARKLCAGTCGRLLRPNRSSPQDYPPHTVITVAFGRCGRCYQRRRLEQQQAATA